MQLFNKIVDRVRYEFDIEREMQKNKRTREQAEKWQQKKIAQAVEKDVKIELKKISQGYAVYEVANVQGFITREPRSLRNKNLKRLTQKKYRRSREASTSPFQRIKGDIRVYY